MSENLLSRLEQSLRQSRAARMHLAARLRELEAEADSVRAELAEMDTLASQTEAAIYRLATDRGVRVVENRPGRLILRQGRTRLEIEINGGTGHRLLAPQAGMMCRTVREVASCPAWFRFEVGGRVILDACSEQTSYELVP